MAKYRTAVIGLGRMGSTFDDEIEQGGSIFLPYCHAPSYNASAHTDLVAGADPHGEQRSIFGDRWGIDSDHMYDDYRTMLNQENLDILSICTTARIRAQIVNDAAHAGVKAIWAEKPIALSLSEADGMVRVCREHGVSLAVNCARRWNPFFARAKELIDEGELGDILQVTGYGQCGLSHNGSHLIDIVRYLAGGEVEWVFGEMESDEAAASDNDLMGNGYLAFDNGVRGFIRGMPTGLAQWEVDVIGTKGRFRSSDGGQSVSYFKFTDGGPRGRQVPAEVPFPWPSHVQGMGLTILDDIVSSMENGHPPKCSGDDGLAAFEIAVALRESHRQGGQRISLPLADRSLAILSSEIREDDTPARIRRLNTR
jgi:predicted dehydrogenase